MTRMWVVPPESMCQQHKLGEHKEIHDLVGFIRGGHIEKVRFHAARGQVFPRHIEARHACLEQALDLDSPIDVPGMASVLEMATPTAALIRHNMSELARRCDDCAALMPDRQG